MSASYSVEIDVPQSLVRITMAGFFAEGDVAAFAAERDRAYRQLCCRPNGHVTLVDIRDMQIQSQDSVLRFQQLLSDPAAASRRIAFVVARSLARMQVKRAAAGLQAGFFLCAGEAEQWLMGDQPAAQDGSAGIQVSAADRLAEPD